MTCNCYSYNWCIGETPEVVLEVPKDLQVRMHREYVCVDACIVEYVKTLWEAGIITHGACCGHNKIPASMVLEDDVSQETVDKCERILNRSFEFYSWIHPIHEDDKITHVNRKIKCPTNSQTTTSTKSSPATSHGTATTSST